MSSVVRYYKKKKWVRTLLTPDLVQAIEKNDVVQLRQYRKTGKRFNCRDENKNTLLHVAVTRQEDESTIDALDYLLSLKEVPKNSKNWRGNTPLMEAFTHDWYSQRYIYRMIAAGCDIHQKYEDKSTLLHFAVRNDWLQVAEFLIEKGLEVNCQNSKSETPLHWACDYGLVDEVWMLLFYGADPNTRADDIRSEVEYCTLLPASVPRPIEEVSCFDKAARYDSKPRIREVFLNQLVAYERSFNLKTFVKSLEGEALQFPKLVKIASDISYNEHNSKEFLCTIKNFPDLFQLFMQKFAYVVRGVFETYEINLLDCGYVHNIPAFIKITLSLFDNTINTLLDHSKDSLMINYIIDMFLDSYPSSLETITQVIFCMLSYGASINTLAINQIYFKCGYCDLFKSLLHMNLTEECNFENVFTDSFYNSFESHLEFSVFLFIRLQKLKTLTNLIIPQIIYDVTMKVPSTIQSFAPVLTAGLDLSLTRNIVSMMFAHFALSESVKNSIFDLVECQRLFDEEEYQDFMDAEKYPTIPTLMELSRNRTRDYIIEKYKIKNSMQFYTLLAKLPIPSDYKEIISFEKRLYPLIRNY